jgi:amino-acid N-acetyltransferase
MEELTPARRDDEAAVVALLAACDLPHQDVAKHLEHFTVARDGGRVIGVIGLEVHGSDGLLRSLAVAPDRRGEGIARRLYALLIQRARALGLARLYLLTTTARGFFALLGFRTLARESVPDSIRATEEFRVLCPADAVCMVRPLPKEAHG